MFFSSNDLNEPNYYQNIRKGIRGVCLSDSLRYSKIMRTEEGDDNAI